MRTRYSFTTFLLLLGLALSGHAVTAADVMLTTKDLRRVGNGPLIAPDIAGLPADPALAIVDLTDPSAAARQLQGLVSRGLSQGFGGILYENRDRGHSILPRTMFPNLTFLTYDQELKKQRLDYGLAGPILIPALVFGNSSTALTAGNQQRSLVRLAMTTNGGAARAFRDYVANSLYIYPEHKDHDAVDLFPANWPYAIMSQGSSYSDGPFLQAVAMTLAAFPAETRAALLSSGLVAPTVQMILRRNLTLVRTRAHYLSTAAHPTAFSSKWLQPGRMIGHAAALRPEDIPPVVRLKVLGEDFDPGAGLAGRDERLFSTPSAIARIWRSSAWEKQMIVSAEPTVDPNDRDLQFKWVLLRGDPTRVNIEPLDPAGRSARITVSWHDAFAVAPRSPADDIARKSSRVDIGVFAWNGRSDSAPAFISVTFPTHQKRVYEPDAKGSLRLSSVDYDAQQRNQAFDPVLYWSAPWADSFDYGPDGALHGWTRVQGDTSTRFDAVGQLQDGSPVTYSVVESTDHIPTLQATPSEPRD